MTLFGQFLYRRSINVRLFCIDLPFWQKPSDLMHQTQVLLAKNAQNQGPLTCLRQSPLWRTAGSFLDFDLTQDARVLDQAYNDRLGIAAAFNLNVLERLNRNSMPISTCAGFNIGRSITQSMGERRCSS
jgi:Histidine-specific methyltransferase, SAM-dependent